MYFLWPSWKLSSFPGQGHWQTLNPDLGLVTHFLKAVSSGHCSFILETMMAASVLGPRVSGSMAAPVGHPREVEEAASGHLVGVRLDASWLHHGGSVVQSAFSFSQWLHITLSPCGFPSQNTTMCFLEVEILFLQPRGFLLRREFSQQPIHQIAYSRMWMKGESCSTVHTPPLVQFSSVAFWGAHFPAPK